jgi:hypothetical protein
MFPVLQSRFGDIFARMPNDKSPFLVTTRGSLDRWFDEEPRPSVLPGASQPPSPPLPSRGRSTIAGGVVGAFAGIVATAIAALAWGHATIEAARAIGGAASPTIDSAARAAVGFAIVGLLGGLAGIGLSRLTRHVRRVTPLLLFGMIFAPALWLALYVFVLGRVTPHLAAALPFNAILIGSATFGGLLALLVPLRGRPRLAR